MIQLYKYNEILCIYSKFSLLFNYILYNYIKIWNAFEGTPLANYRGHSEKLLCCMFSLVEPNIVYSGGEVFIKIIFIPVYIQLFFNYKIRIILCINGKLMINRTNFHQKNVKINDFFVIISII
jgi:hypothetical protein